METPAPKLRTGSFVTIANIPDKIPDKILDLATIDIVFFGNFTVHQFSL